ncbi:hypothetical protein ANK1_4082 [plant metagenome]|uniref:Uncharacterized protein n=1 Tax=plant metagenome TaxID=1297885 RepID=A0A484SE87_9ZZZZ
MDVLFARIRDADAARPEEARLDGNIFKTLFLNHAPLVTDEVFPALQFKLSDALFQRDFLAQFRKVIKAQRDHVLTEAEKCEAAGVNPLFYTMQLPPLERQLAIDSLDAYLAFLRDPAEGHPGIVEILAGDYAYLHDGTDGTAYLSQYYALYRIGSFLYEQYLAKLAVFQRFDAPCAAELEKLYQSLDIDLAAADVQFDKYGLLSLNDDIRIVNGKDSRTVVDGRLGLNFWIDVPGDLLKALETAIANRWVTDIAFDVVQITEDTPAFEAVEYGNLFSFDALQLPRVSKLYDEDRYDDALWIKVDARPPSMTFEELCTDFPVLDGTVVTQVVHLEFGVDQGEQIISHLDHEYILYSQDAYDRRRHDAGVKGHAKRKTFKIDRARIPFGFSFNDRYFLFLVLDSYFKNKGLVREYFSTVSIH